MMMAPLLLLDAAPHQHAIENNRRKIALLNHIGASGKCCVLNGLRPSDCVCAMFATPCVYSVLLSYAASGVVVPLRNPRCLPDNVAIATYPCACVDPCALSANNNSGMMITLDGTLLAMAGETASPVSPCPCHVCDRCNLNECHHAALARKLARVHSEMCAQPGIAVPLGTRAIGSINLHARPPLAVREQPTKMEPPAPASASLVSK